MVRDRPAEFREICEWDWMVSEYGEVLHHATVAYDIRYDVGGEGVTSCGRKGTYWIPGMFTRMDARRCDRCCRALGYPSGIGSPKNDERCRPLVEARLK